MVHLLFLTGKYMVNTYNNTTYKVLAILLTQTSSMSYVTNNCQCINYLNPCTGLPNKDRNQL